MRPYRPLRKFRGLFFSEEVDNGEIKFGVNGQFPAWNEAERHPRGWYTDVFLLTEFN
jgi:hypothetical protein